MFGLVHCDAWLLARQNTDPRLFFVRSLVKNWLWPIITFFGVTGNILAIIVLTKRRMIMSSTNNYLVALAIVDIAYLLLTLIVNSSQHPCFTGSTFSDILVTICRPIADFSSNTSVWLTVTFTVERWVAITYPLQSRTWCTVHRARKIIISVMCAALVCTSPSAFETKLVRVVEVINGSNETVFVSRIRAKPTALAESELYHQIYFNFVTFAIVWIPLVLLIIFNTILIIYVHRSRQSEHDSSNGIKLRRHNRGNQGEQRKTTIMLIAVVIVFTVCQIPQAISLTVQSFFQTLSRSPTVLIGNNFANCLVAVNASINFVLYCCFSDRFRATFGSSFAFLSKYCAHLIEPNGKLRTTPTKMSVSMDNVSFTGPYNPSMYSLHGQPLNTRISNISTDTSQRCLGKTSSDASQRHLRSTSKSPARWAAILSKFAPGKKSRGHPSADVAQTLIWQNTDTDPSVPITSGVKCSSLFVRQAPSSAKVETSAIDDTTTRTHLESQPSSSCPFDRAKFAPTSSEKLQLMPGVARHRLGPTSKFRYTYHSHRSLNDQDGTREQIWIKRRVSNSAVEKILDRRNPFFSKEMIDVTV